MTNEPARIRDEAGLDAALDAPIAVLYKHSPHCGASRAAAREVGRFGADHPSIPVYLLDVIESRALARDVATRLGVPHESPQVILLRDGRAVWDASHGAVTAAALAREVDGPSPHDTTGPPPARRPASGRRP